jgi:transposase
MEVALRIKKSFGIQRGKSDKVDAKRIAEYGMRNFDKLRLWEPTRATVLYIKDLLINRERIDKAINNFIVASNELAEFCPSEELRWLTKINESAIIGLTKSLELNTKKINELMAQDKKIKRLHDLLTSIPQIGTLTALHLICCTKEFRLHTNAKTLACYIGVAPFEHSSGKSIRGKTRVSHMANKKIKALIHLAALRSIMKKGMFREYYVRKKAEGKHGMSILNAIRNKLIHRIAAVVRRGTPYEARG